MTLLCHLEWKLLSILEALLGNDHGGIRLCDSLEFVTSENNGKLALNQTR